jgi:peptidylprolyl isomerase
MKEVRMAQIKIVLTNGSVVIETLPNVAPKHVARIIELVKSGFYDGLAFHRVIDGFMAQTGCPLGNGTGGSGVKIPAEFSSEHFSRGTVGMARAFDINSADSQFFICFENCGFLDGKYTVWGRVVSGMEHVDKIKRGDEFDNGHVENPDKIIKMEIME